MLAVRKVLIFLALYAGEVDLNRPFINYFTENFLLSNAMMIFGAFLFIE